MMRDEAAAREWFAAQEWCTPEAIERIALLELLLREENEKQNLVSSASLDQLWQRHVVDSAQLLQFVPRETLASGDSQRSVLRGTSWLDLGSGAGFPGLVIAAIRPYLPVVLVESRRRRSDWLLDCGRRMGLLNLRVEAQRLQQVDTVPVAVISARAFAPLDKLLSLSARFSTPETLWLLPKGRSAADEVASLTGWRHKFHVEQSLTDDESGIVVGTMQGKLGAKA